MRVKRLEIQGFKSFKDKTVIHFDHSITGIVGPNGCGKSNIVDAFFWVMGEQSYKHMRGNSSEDLIFNGSSKYSPLGIAEATLVMETDILDTANAPDGATVQDLPIHLRTKELSVTRRLYRSGEGEYFINGTLARLKDIQELFMDTGVGAKGYSVIEQGQIGKIVNAKPEDRRLLIEEAAGIAKYKARKKESLRKMEATQGNLSRLNDIVVEIEKNLASLERQAQKARQYKKYKDELLDKEMSWGRRKSRLFRQKLEVLRKEHEELEQDLVGLRAELQTSENSIEIDRVDLVTESKEAESLQAKIQDLADDLSQERSALELSRQRQGDLVDQLQALESEKAELHGAIESDSVRLAETEIQALEADQFFQNTAQEARQMSEVLNQLRKEFEKARIQVDSNQRDLMSGITQISELTSKAAGLLSRVESARAQGERFSQQSEVQTEKIETVQEELEATKTAVQEIKEKRNLLQMEKKEQTSKLQTDEQSLRNFEKLKNDSLRALTQLKSKLQSLQELDESHEGLADGPKAALDWAKSHGKNHHILALTDSLEVKNGYETVLESWLENRIENLMTHDSQLALTLLNQVRQDKQGRVNIQLIAESFQETPSRSPLPFNPVRELLEKHGFKVHGQLSDFVTSRSQYLTAIAPLLNTVCVVESSEPILTFIQESGLNQLLGWAIATLDGVVLESQGLMRGGSLDASGAIGILRRKRSIEELRDQVTLAEADYQKMENSVSEAKLEIDIARARLQTLQSEIQTLEIQSAALDRDVHQTEKALQQATSHLHSLERDAHEMNLEVERALEEREDIEFKLKDLISTRTEIEDTISSAENELAESERVLRDHDSKLQSVRVQEASLRERAMSLKRETEAIRSILSDRKRRLTEICRTLERATREQAQFSGGESELSLKIEELTLALSEARERLAEVKDKMERANTQVNLTLEKIKNLHKSGDYKTSESMRFALEIEKLSGDLSHLILNLEEKYGTGCLEIQPMIPTEDLSSEVSAEEEIILSEEVERLRERIRRLGEVNVMAIEEFEYLKKRYDHLQNEKQDLERSLQNLQEAIEHINKTSEDRFRKAFESIAERFQRLFPIIFGGGQAKLSLIYPEGSNEILDAGVDILAQPPGKKIANITLLSGGEKALTAVSLIFAIFMVKPSPFCVLDEVDAPLDDANIGKFNALLREMSVKSQFILITHNKKTMELNDTLYGVTMEEPGVSKMVSIEMH